MNKETVGAIYILTNPSFPDYVKIGYANDVNKRLKELNSRECVPYAFRLYAYYKVSERLADKELHALIDTINPELRTREINEDGKFRTREFYKMKPETAYLILEKISKIDGLSENLIKPIASEEELESEEEAEEYNLSINRHHFKNISFSSSITGHLYRSYTNENGTLSIFDETLGKEIPNNSNPSKRKIVQVALSDITKQEETGTLYQSIHKLEKILSKEGKHI